MNDFFVDYNVCGGGPARGVCVCIVSVYWDEGCKFCYIKT